MLAGAALAPQAWPWWLGGVAANHALLTTAGLLPRCALLGPNLRRLPAGESSRGVVALTFDDGPDPEVTPRVLDALALAGMQATFFCIGERVRGEPALARRIVAEGHEIGNHSARHRYDFAFLGPRGIGREIDEAQAICTGVAGVVPRFFRAPAGIRSPLLEPQLAARGLRLAAWTRRGFDTVRAEPARVLHALTTRLAARDVLLLHDGHAARTVDGTPIALAVLPALLERLRTAGLASRTLSAAVGAHG